MTTRRLEDLGDVEPLWPAVGRFLGLGRNSTFEAARRGEIPTLRFRKKLMVSKIAIARLLSEGQRPARLVGSDREPTALRASGAK
jgi:hypothetical protein